MDFKTVTIVVLTISLIGISESRNININKTSLKKFLSEDVVEIEKFEDKDVLTFVLDMLDNPENNTNNDTDIIKFVLDTDDENTNLFNVFLKNKNISKTETEFLQKYFDEYNADFGNLIIKNGRFTWRINRYSSYLPDLNVWETINTAFEFWESITKIRFQYKNDYKTDIKIMFTDYQHLMSNGYPCETFYQGTLAHAYYPDTPFAGEMHFNDHQIFDKDKRSYSYSLLRVAVHEIGHLLGLRHNDRKFSIMYPYEGYNKHHRLNLNLFDVYDKKNFE